MQWKPYALPFPAVPGIVPRRKGCAENRGNALGPLGKVCIESKHRPGSRPKDAKSSGGLAAYIDVFIPALIPKALRRAQSQLSDDRLVCSKLEA